MTNYTKTTDFAVKDTLLTGNPNKLVKGSEVDVEFNNLALADLTNIKKTGSAGSAIFPSGTTAQRDAVPAIGYARANTTTGLLEWWNGTEWTSPNGANSVSYNPAGTGAVATTVQGKLRESVSVKDFGAVGDGVTDDSVAIRSAIAAGSGGTIIFPKPSSSYLLGSSLGDIPINTTLKGPGRYTACLKRGYSGGYLVNFLDGSGYQDMMWDGNGGTYTGGIVNIPLAAGNQTVTNCRFVNASGGTPIHFTAVGAVGSGSRSIWTNVDAWRVDGAAGTGNYAVVYDNPGVIGGCPVHFIGFESGGYCSFDFGAVNDFYITNSTVFDCNFTDNVRGLHVAAGRWAGSSGYTLKGGGDFTGAAFGSLVTFAANSAYHFTGELNVGYVDSSGAAGSLAMFNYAVNTFTPEFKAGGVAIVIGNGSLYGKWTRTGRIVSFTAILTVGSTTTGMAGGAISLTVPVPTVSVSNQRDISFYIYNNTTEILGSGNLNGATIFFKRDTSGTVSSGTPIALTPVGTVISVSGNYIV